MNKKKEELEAIADLLHEWCVEYNEPYVYAFAFNELQNNLVNAGIDSTRPDYWETSVRKNTKPQELQLPGNQSNC